MTRPIARAAAMVAWLLVGTGAPAWAQEAMPAAPGFQMAGEGLQAFQVTPQVLAGLPRIEQEVSFQTAKGVEAGRYEGVLLWGLMKKAGITQLPGHHAELRRTFVVTGSDGYAIAFSVGEISPDFGNKAVMIAEHVDGKPLASDQGLRLIVPGDARGARSVRDVARIEVR